MKKKTSRNSTKTAARRVPGRPFTKNDPRINRKGRPEGTAGFAQMIRDVNSGGADIIAFAMNMRDGHIQGASAKVRFDANEWLADRALGRVPQSIEVTGAGGGPIEVKDARKRLAERLAALTPAGAAPGADPKPH